MKHKILFTALALALSTGANADTKFGLGIGAMSGESAYTGVDDDVSFVPLLSIDSDNYYFFGTQFGYQAGDLNGIEMTLIADYRTDGFEAADSTTFVGMEDRTGTLELGIELEYESDVGDFAVSFMSDALGEHEGSEFSASYSLPIVLRTTQLAPFAKATYQSTELVDYYYGVRAGEATATRSAYEGDATLNYEIGVQARWQSGAHHQVLTSLSYETWGDEITDSPLVDSDGGLQALVGYVYVF